jgi:hypothetical protein
MFMLTSIALKFSLMVFFRQFIFERTQRNLMTLVTAFYCIISAASFFLAIFPCGAPIHLARKRIENQCVPPAIWNGLLYTHGTTSALSDWIFALLPILVLWKSSMPARTKFGVTLLMVLAVCGSLCAVLRTIYTGSLDFDERDYDADNESNYYHCFGFQCGSAGDGNWDYGSFCSLSDALVQAMCRLGPATSDCKVSTG